MDFNIHIFFDVFVVVENFDATNFDSFDEKDIPLCFDFEKKDLGAVEKGLIVLNHIIF